MFHVVDDKSKDGKKEEKEEESKTKAGTDVKEEKIGELFKLYHDLL